MGKRWIFGCCLIVLVTAVDAVQSASHQKMTEPLHCLGLVLSRAHRSQTFRVRSLLECLSRCRAEENCRSILFDSHSFLCYLANVGSEEDCSNLEAGAENLRFYEMAQSDPSLEEARQSPLELNATGTVSHGSTDNDWQPSVPPTTGVTTDAPTLTPALPTSALNPDTITNTYTDVSTQSSEVCQNGGQLNENGTCVCVNSTVGPYCKRFMEDCAEGRDSGFYTKHGQYYIQPTRSPSPFRVYCHMLKNRSEVARTLVFKRFDPTFSFNRTWQDFHLGFGDTRADHWLGLDKLYQLTNSKNYELRFSIMFNGTLRWSFFHSFVVSDEANGYKFTVGFNHNAGMDDCMSELQGASFSTYDADADNNSAINCAAVFGGGWWYNGHNNCSACNLLGPVLSDNGSERLGIRGEMFWSGFGSAYPFPLSAYLLVPYWER